MDRQCTDMFCGIVLVVCAIAFFGVAGYALAKGDPEKIFSGVDGNTRMCGQPGQTLNYPYLLVVPYSTPLCTDADCIIAAEYKTAVCVKDCPAKGATPDCLPTNATTSCSDFATLGFGTKQVFLSCITSEAADTATKQLDAGISKI